MVCRAERTVSERGEAGRIPVSTPSFGMVTSFPEIRMLKT
jgi:hypothetical protein